VFNNNPHVRAIYHPEATPKIDLYDLYVNLDDAYELNPTNHYLDSYFYRIFGTSDLDKRVELFPNKDDQAVVDQFIADNELDQFIVIHIRQWYWALKNVSWDTWYAVFEKLFAVRTDFKIVCVGTAQDGYVEHPLFVDARDRLSVQQQKLLMDHASCFVGIDSGPYHIAVASRTHIVSLHTHLLPERIAPLHKPYTPILSFMPSPLGEITNLVLASSLKYSVSISYFLFSSQAMVVERILAVGNFFRNSSRLGVILPENIISVSLSAL
jgi:ADP-heptose:LPS heptosyltransferase